MKKIILAAALMLTFAFAASAQPRAIGARLGANFEATYQHTVHEEDFVEATLGLFLFNELDATATYNFMIAQPAWTARGEWGFYAGPGAAAGVGFVPGATFATVAVMGQVGLEYTFWFPLQLSVDLRPRLGLMLHDKAYFYTPGLYGFAPCLSVRYRF